MSVIQRDACNSELCRRTLDVWFWSVFRSNCWKLAAISHWESVVNRPSNEKLKRTTNLQNRNGCKTLTECDHLYLLTCVHMTSRCEKLSWEDWVNCHSTGECCQQTIKSIIQAPSASGRLYPNYKVLEPVSLLRLGYYVWLKLSFDSTPFIHLTITSPIAKLLLSSW